MSSENLRGAWAKPTSVWCSNDLELSFSTMISILASVQTFLATNLWLQWVWADFCDFASLCCNVTNALVYEIFTPHWLFFYILLKTSQRTFHLSGLFCNATGTMKRTIIMIAAAKQVVSSGRFLSYHAPLRWHITPPVRLRGASFGSLWIYYKWWK